MKSLNIIYEVDEQGFILDSYVSELDHNGDILEEDKKHMISTSLPEGLYKPKWNGSEWIEGETKEERAEREGTQQLEDFIPSPKELAEAELEIKIISLLTELEVI